MVMGVPEATVEASVLATPMRRRMRQAFGPEISPACEAEFVIEFGDVADRILKAAGGGRADLIGIGVHKAPEITAPLDWFRR